MAHERTKNISAKEALKKKAPDFIQAINSLVSEINDKAEKEKSKPQYRFMQTYDAYEAIKEAYRFEKIITEYNFIVDIYEDLECKDVSKSTKYTIKISNTSGVYVEIDLLYYEEKIKDFEFDATEYIANNLAKITGSVNKQVRELAPIVAEYIACLMYTKRLYKLKYNKMGWDYYINDENNGSWIFKYDQIYSDNKALFNLKDEKYATDLLNLKGHLPKSMADGLGVVEKDNLKKELDWVEHTIKIMNNHVFDCLILGAGISGLVRQLLPYTKETNININIVGKPASGKSTICHYLLSIFGNPERIEGSFIDTDNSIEETRAKRPVLPYVLDDRMLKIETESEKNKQKVILMDIFREYEGKVKERYGKQYEETSGDRIYGPIISSSVKRMMDYAKESVDIGQYRRFIEFEIEDNALFKNAAEATATESIAYKNYGYGIRIIINYMMGILNDTLTDDTNNKISSEATKFIERFGTLKEEVERRLNEEEKNINNNKVRGMASSASRFALIIISYKILREALLLYNYEFIMSNIKKDAIDNTEEFIKMFAVEDKKLTFLEFVKNSNIIKDYSDEILDILINNLVNKMLGIKRTPEEQVNKIYDYILQHTEQFKRQSDIEHEKEEFNKMYNSKGKYLGAYNIVEDTNEMILYTPKDFYIEQFLFMDTIPEPEIITEYVEYIFDNDMTGASKAKEHGKKYKTNNNYKDMSNGKRNQKDIEFIIDGKKTIKKKEFRKLTLKYTKLNEEDDKE